MSKNELEKLRENINEVDDHILDLLAKRASIVSKIGKHKNSNKTVVDLVREEEILNRLLKKTIGNYSKDTIIRIWRELFQASSNLQMFNFSEIKTKRTIESINIYKGGQTSIKGKSNIIKLSSNENTNSPNNSILKEIKEIKFQNKLNRYPEISGLSLRKEIGNFHGIDPERIVLGCGSDEILLFAALSFCKDGDEIIHAEHGFEMYPVIAKVVGAVSKLIKEDENYKVTVKSILNQITEGTKLIFIANPNNPTGTYLNRVEIIELMNALPKNITVLLDGAYAEYVIENDFDKGFDLVEKFENLILTRTFSKVYGLAGLRIGWSYSSEKIAKILNKVKGPFNTNFFAQEIAIKVLNDQNHINNVVKLNHEIKNWFEKELNNLNLKTRVTFGNFSLIESNIKEANNIFNHLLDDGIIVRKLDSYNLPNCLRITIGTMKEMETTLESLKKYHG
tara:strand:+ start:289 stop:1641 length:1353 start_codon:yes stop_codon:yes gene_type:complete